MANNMYKSPKRIENCRICGNTKLDPVIDLGAQALTGRFRAIFDAAPPVWPITLVRCSTEDNNTACGCSQLLHKYDQRAFFGKFYGYRSSVTKTMRDHLAQKAADLASRLCLTEADAVLDIGCNDGTLLKSFIPFTSRLYGCDPSAGQFSDEMEKQIDLTVDFFPSERLNKALAGAKPRLITSIACFYDVDNPIDFASHVKLILASDGIWEVEIAYMPRIMELLGYDTVLHEHAVYYGLSQMEWIARHAGLRVFHAEENSINGASIRILMTHLENQAFEETSQLKEVRAFEYSNSWQSREMYDQFAMRILAQRDEFQEFMSLSKKAGKRLFAYGASTKGNVILQYCGVNSENIPYALERFSPKFGLITPGTQIHIIAEEQGRAMKPDALIVLIWQFKAEVLEREREYISSGGRIVFLLPSIEIYGPKGLETVDDFLSQKETA